MNDIYKPLKQDYIRSAILGVIYTCVAQMWKLLTFQLNNSVYTSRLWNHMYWILTMLLKCFVIMVLLYPQVDEVTVPRRMWNITVGQILIMGCTITLTELMINFGMIRARRSLLYNFYNRGEFDNYKTSFDINQLRRNSSITMMYKIKTDLKQQEIDKRYYIGEEDDGQQQLETPLLVLDENLKDSKIIASSIDFGAGGGIGGHIDFPNGDTLRGGIGGGFEYGRNKSGRSSNGSVEMASTSTDEEELAKRDKLLHMIGILNVPEYVLNLEIPIITKDDLFMGNEYYELLVTSNILALSRIWKLDNLVLNLFECLCISSVFLYKMAQDRVVPLILMLMAFRLTRYEIWRFFLLLRFKRQRQKSDFSSSNYGAIADRLKRDHNQYYRQCRLLTYIVLLVDVVMLSVVVCVVCV